MLDRLISLLKSRRLTISQAIDERHLGDPQTIITDAGARLGMEIVKIMASKGQVRGDMDEYRLRRVFRFDIVWMTYDELRALLDERIVYEPKVQSAPKPIAPKPAKPDMTKERQSILDGINRTARRLLK